MLLGIWEGVSLGCMARLELEESWGRDGDKLRRANIPHTEEISNTNIDKDNQTSASTTLNSSCGDQHRNANGGSRNNGAHEENNIGN